jgi:YVTN family beta-propeller protein
VEFGILGPLAVLEEGRELEIGGPKPRALLARLLLEPNQPVSRDGLIEALWGERAPASASHTLDNYVSRLRRVLGSDRLERRRPGYALRVEPGELDLDRFDTLARRGRQELAEGSAERAAQTLRAALDVWRGQALADVPMEWLTGEAERLEELRLTAVEDWVEAELARGSDAQLVSELERILREHPLRERLTGQLMLALYRSGRQTAALDAYRATRTRLAQELGLEPGPHLRELERRILEHDPALQVDSPSPKPGLGTKRRGRLWVLVGALALAATAAGVGVGLDSGRSGSRIAESSASRLLELAGARQIGHGTKLDSAPVAAVTGGRSIWLTEPDAGDVVQVDISSGNHQRIAVGGQPAAVAVGGGSVWVADGGSVKRIDPKLDKVTQTLGLGGTSAAALAFGQGRLWVADTNDESLLVFDPLSGRLDRTIQLSLHPTALAFGAGALWVADYGANLVAEIDPHSPFDPPLAAIPVGSGPTALAVDATERAVWVANFLDSTVSRIDPARARVVATIPVGSGPTAIAIGGDAVWVANEYSQTISRIDRQLDTVARPLRVGGAPTALAESGRLFVATRPLGQHRGGSVVLLHTNPITIDPALQVDVRSPASDGLTRDDLVTTSHAGGMEGQHLVPDLALSVPTAGDGGHTYTFRLRPGIRYSNGRLVRASDFRRELERVFRLHSPAAGYFADIVGAAACTRLRCNLARGIVTNDTARTITFRLKEPEGDFLSNLTIGGLASPVPPGTPFQDDGYRPIPSTGPYKVAAASKREIRYVRNPYFHEWSHAAQPAGNPDEIIMRFGLTEAQEVRAVEQGRADYTDDGVPISLLPQVEARFAEQLYRPPSTDTETLQLNTALPPFNDLRVRQALNLAVDRSALVRLYGGPKAATPTCQVLPPGITGYVRYCPWTRDPRPDGRWLGPDLARARALVSAAGARGKAVTVWGPSDVPIGPGVVSYVVRLLRRLGFRARAHLIPQDRFGSFSQRFFERRIQITPPGWGDSTPYGFFGTWFLCSAAFNHHWFCNPQLDRAITSAETLEATNPAAASRAWTRIDHEVTDQAAWVPLVNSTVFDLVSRRVRNYESTPAGPLVDQFWVR